MSPVTKWVLGGVFALVVAICVAGAVVIVVSDEDSGVESNLGDDTFDDIVAEIGAATIAEDGAPLVFPDLVEGGRVLYVQHLGDEPERGWYAFEAVAPGTDDCIVEWDGDVEQFEDCTGTVYPADGTGLTAYDAEVNSDGRVVIDLGRGTAAAD